MVRFLKFNFLIFCIIFCSINNLSAQYYATILSGQNVSPPNASTAKGFATVSINGNNLHIFSSFAGLLAGTTASHIHAATPIAFSGNAGVATITPTFTGFPNGVSSGTYNHTFDMSLTSSYNNTFLTTHGGTAAQAWADLKTAMIEGKSYFDIHSSAFPGGEIRGFLVPGCTTTKTGNWNNSTVWSCGQVPNNTSFVFISQGHIITIPTNFTANAKNIEINGELKKETNATLNLSQ